MADDTLVSNAPDSDNPDIPVRATETAGGKLIQHVRLDLGSGAAEAQATSTVPVSGTISATTVLVPLTASAPAVTTVNAVSASVLAANPNRKGAVFTNHSPTGTMWFGIGTAALSPRGITLYPYGVWVMDKDTFSTAQINALCDVPGSTLCIQEFT